MVEREECGLLLKGDVVVQEIKIMTLGWTAWLFVVENTTDLKQCRLISYRYHLQLGCVVFLY